jgi:hypothetical protein
MTLFFKLDAIEIIVLTLFFLLMIYSSALRSLAQNEVTGAGQFFNS